jgi:flavin reductase (DIM6/NTAB) family NADH-FMN oxidoreductase RutF
MACWTTSATGAPILQDAVGAIDCELVETIERYKVVMILGRVVATSSDQQAAPLVHFRGGYLP